jgi:hypothetical protein
MVGSTGGAAAIGSAPNTAARMAAMACSAAVGAVAGIGAAGRG